MVDSADGPIAPKYLIQASAQEDTRDNFSTTYLIGIIQLSASYASSITVVNPELSSVILSLANLGILS